MLYIHVILKAKDPESLPQILELLKQHAALSREEPGCALFEVFQSQNDPQVIILSERWESQSHIDEHRKAPGYTTIYVPQILPLVDRIAHPSTLIV